MKVFESIFGEGVKISSLDAKQIAELKVEAQQYLKDWPLEVLSVDFKYETNAKRDQPAPNDEADIDSFGIEGVTSLIQLLADGLGWDLDDSAIDEAVVKGVFSFLKGFSGEVEGDNQVLYVGEDRERADFDYRFRVNNWSYKQGEDYIDIDGVINHLEVS